MGLKTYKLWIEGKPVLLNRLLSTQAKHQSRLKVHGTKGYFGAKFIWQQMLIQGIPKFTKPVAVEIIVHHSNMKVYDFDASLKTVLDAIKQSDNNPLGIIDDNIKGMTKLVITFKKWSADGVQVLFKEP
jgi:hypothetical protein